MFDVPNAEELREFLKKYNLTGAEAARLVGVDSRTIRKWTASEEAANRRSMPWSAWALLRVRVGAVTVQQLDDETQTYNPRDICEWRPVQQGYEAQCLPSEIYKDFPRDRCPHCGKKVSFGD